MTQSRYADTVKQNINLLCSLLPANEKFYVWAYNAEGFCIGSSSPENEQPVLEYIFQLCGGLKRIHACFKKPESRPVLIGSPLGLQWVAVQYLAYSDPFIVLLGPVFYSAPDETSLRNAIYAIPDQVKKGRYVSEFLDISRHLPVISFSIFSRYIVMICNTLNAEQITITDLFPADPLATRDGTIPVHKRNRTEVYYAERALLSMVRNGDLNYQSAFLKSINISPGVNIRGKDPLRQAKTSIIVFTSLVCRAAMEGGLSPEEAYEVGDSYIQSTEDCRDSAELSSLAYAMYQDFIYRVHRIRSNPGISHAIQKCCNYIEVNLGQKIRTSDLAALVGYTDYYLTEKFKKETGMSVSTYIRFAKIERAKVLLETTNLTVNEISDKLAFNTPNYFIQVFREVTEYTPAQYRQRFHSETNTAGQ